MGAWQIPLSGVKAPAPNPSPLEAVYQAQNQNLNAQSMMSQDALRQQQIQQAQLQNQLQQMQINAQQAYNDEMRQTYANIANRAAAPSSPSSAASSSPTVPAPLGTDAQGRPTLRQAPGDSGPAASSPAPTSAADAMSAETPGALAGGYLGSANDNSGIAMSYGPEATPGSISGAASPTIAATAATAPAAAGGSSAPTASPQSTPPPARTGSVPVMTPDDLADFARRMALRGQGAQIPGIMKTQYDLMESRLKIEKADGENHQAASTGIAQLMQGLLGMPTANDQQKGDRQAAYQQALPRLRQLTAQMGLNPAGLPAEFDAIAAQRMIDNGTTVANYYSNQRALATHALDVSKDFPKAYEDALTQVNQEIGHAQSGHDYANIYNGLVARADAADTANPGGINFYRQALQGKQPPVDAQGNFTWTPQVSRDAMLDGQTPEARQKYIQQSVTDGSERLAIMAKYGPQAFQEELKKIADGKELGVDPGVADLFKGFHTTNDPDADATVIRNMGMTAAQASLADVRGANMGVIEQRTQLLEAQIKALGLKIGAEFGPGGTKLPGYTPPFAPARPLTAGQAVSAFKSYETQETRLRQQLTDLGWNQDPKKVTGLLKQEQGGTTVNDQKTGNERNIRNEVDTKLTELAEVLDDKYAAYGQLGRGAPSYSLEQARKDIGRPAVASAAPVETTPETAPPRAGTRTPSLPPKPGETPSAQAPGGTPKGQAANAQAKPPAQPAAAPLFFNFPPELAAKLGKKGATFPDRDSAEKFMKAAGLVYANR